MAFLAASTPFEFACKSIRRLFMTTSCPLDPLASVEERGQLIPFSAQEKVGAACLAINRRRSGTGFRPRFDARYLELVVQSAFSSYIRPMFASRGCILASALLFAAVACSDGAGPIPPPPPPSPVQLLTLSTFDGSGQAVHPDAVVTPVSWGSSEIELFATPYPNGNPAFENPSLYSKHSALEWPVPPGVTNPIAQPSDGYLSDPDEVFNPATNELWLYYRSVTTENQILLIRGRSPTAWTAPRLVVSGINHTVVSPTVVRRAAGDWMMWSVNSGTAGCAGPSTTVEFRTSVDGITWSAPTTTDLTEPLGFAWHIDVQWIPSRAEFWALYNVKIPGSCTTSTLHFAKSVDGIHWQVQPGPVLSRGVIPAFADIIYRASLLYDAASDQITLWYSGARFDGHSYTWRIATENMGLPAFLDRVTTPLPAGSALQVTDAPPLTDATAP